MTLGHHLQHFPRGSGWLGRPRSFVIYFLKYFGQNGYLKTLVECIWGKRTRKVKLPSDHFWLLKMELELSTSNQVSPFQSLYDHPFHKINIYNPGFTFNTWPGLWGFVLTLEFLLSDLWTILNKMTLKILIRHIWGKEGVGKGIDPITFHF